MKKYLGFIFVAFAFVLLLVSCLSFSASSVKSKLEKEEYTVSVTAVDDYKSSSIPLSKDDGFTNLLMATKNDDGVIIFFFDSVDNCDKFREKHQSDLVTLRNFGNEGRFGTFNNVAYFGTDAAIKIAGLTH